MGEEAEHITVAFSASQPVREGFAAESQWHSSVRKPWTNKQNNNQKKKILQKHDLNSWGGRETTTPHTPQKNPTTINYTHLKNQTKHHQKILWLQFQKQAAE